VRRHTMIGDDDITWRDVVTWHKLAVGDRDTT
jgi:hypothetical protein